MKLTTKLFIMALMLFFMSSLPTAFAGEYALIDVAKVFDDYQKTKDNDSVLQKLGEEKEKERAVIVDDIRKMKDELELLSNDAKKKKQEAINSRVGELQEYDLQAKRELGEKRQEMVQNIFTDIDDVVQAMGKKGNYDFILNDRALVYKREKLDMTDQALKELNKSYAKSKK